MDRLFTFATLYFDAGTPKERKVDGRVVFGAKIEDLALIRVEGGYDLPSPVVNEEQVPVDELQTLFIFGFPHGVELAMNGRMPSISVTKTVVSSVKEGRSGERKLLQLDGGINKGNSGGPIVNSDGTLVG